MSYATPHDMANEIAHLVDRICDLELDCEGWERTARKAEDEIQRLRSELYVVRENVMVAIEELNGTSGTEAAKWRLRRCLVSELNEGDAGIASASPEPLVTSKNS